jgi:hypothetical protein
MKSLTMKKLGRILLVTPLLFSAVCVSAQIEGPKRGIAPIASTGDFEVTGIEVNTTGKNAEDARKAGWEEAQRLGWVKLWEITHGSKTSSLSDGTLDGIVSAIIVEEEQIGPRRYIAKLGVSFDRARGGQLLGVRGIGRRSAPMLVIPIMESAGAQLVFERQTPWQNVWAKFRTAESKIDYVRPSGAGSESLLLNAGQMDRRSRNWWRVILDQFGAADVVYPIVRLERQWPGGPVVGHFSARYGPDNRYLGSFELRAENSKGITTMLNEGIVKMDQLYQNAFASGRLRAEATLLLEDTIDEEDLAKLEEEAAKVKEPEPVKSFADDDPVAAAVDSVVDDPNKPKPEPKEDKPKPDKQVVPPVAPQQVTVSVQVSTPTPESVDRAEASLRSIPGVRSVSTSSLALGGTSVMRVTYQGDPAALKSALASRGFR